MMHCPQCLRKLSAAAGRPNFCMHCGHKLAPADAPAEAVGPLQAAALINASPQETMAFDYQVPASSVTSEGNSALSEVSGDSSGSSLTAIAGYSFTRFLGAGGMGTVYEAESAATGQRVAVKLLAARLAANPSSVERFRQEGRVASQITHPRCVFVLRADTESGRPFIIMELMPGKTLKDLVDQTGPLPHAAAVGRILDAIDGLAEAHRLGVIHRDVKPSNCFLTDDDRVKIGDFGLSKSLAPDEDEDGVAARQLTTSGAFLGTVMFASPEQIRGEPVGYDSDVYAVCGTLYYLLTGKAPYQHESLTASLAKAVSEPPPPIRDRFPDVPRELERAVLRGLERDRTRRWQSLDDLRDALDELQSEKLQPARPRAIILAYLLDLFVLLALMLLVEFPRQAFLGVTQNSSVTLDLLEFSWPGVLASVLYFSLGEGLYGATIGKRLLRLRVTRVGRVGPPGLAAAGLRAVAFTAVWTLMYAAPELGVELFGRVGAVAGLGVAALAVAVLLLQFRRTAHGWRGVHDFASGCRVIQRPRPPHRPRLVSLFGNPLDRLKPTATALPRALGSFAVSGKLCDLPDGGEVWTGDDRSLGRRILLRVLPPGVREFDTADLAAAATRPTRLRVIGNGSFGATAADGRVERRGWVAYVAPAGAPLTDVVAPGAALDWIDARPVLEQLTDELTAAEDDETPLGPTCVEQVWVEPNGRLQLLDFPLPTGRQGLLAPDACPTLAPIDLVRQTAALALEGAARSTPGRIRAPIPPHAAAITDRLFDDAGPPATVADLRHRLADNHAYAPELTAAGRAAHLSVLALMIALPMALMFLAAALVPAMLAVVRTNDGDSASLMRSIFESPERRARLLMAVQSDGHIGQPTVERLRVMFGPEELPRTLARLDERVIARQRDESQVMASLNRVERRTVEYVRADNDSQEPDSKRAVQLAAAMAVRSMNALDSSTDDPRVMRLIRNGMVRFGIVVVFSFPLAWAAFAFAFRGGLTMKIAGVTLVTAKGRLAPRWRCAVRELVVWSPLVAFLVATLVLQESYPGWVFLRTATLLLALLVLPVYLVVALRQPTHPPQDRLLGTYLVPA